MIVIGIFLVVIGWFSGIGIGVQMEQGNASNGFNLGCLAISAAILGSGVYIVGTC